MKIYTDNIITNASTPSSSASIWSASYDEPLSLIQQLRKDIGLWLKPILN